MGNSRITHVITGLETGGAEMMLLKLIRESRDRIDHSVISLRGVGPVGERLVTEGVPVRALDLAGPRDALLVLPRLAVALKRSQPDLVQGWMYHGNLAASLGSLFSGNPWPTAWSIRCTIGNFRDELSATRSIFSATWALSRHPRAIIYNSAEARREHERAGYPANAGSVIPNGFDLVRFTPDSAVRAAERARIGVAKDQILIGLVARLHLMKDPGNFVAAADQIAREFPQTVFLIAGRGMPSLCEQVPALQPLAVALGPRLILLPEIAEVTPLLNALDIFALTSSYGEGFPNALGEAMAMALPAIATDVGDSAAVLGDFGLVVPPRQSAATAGAMRLLLEMNCSDRNSLGQKARARVIEHYSIQAVAARYENAWNSMAGKA